MNKMATEYISRETVLKYVEDWSCGYDYIETETNGAINDIKAIPAADVRPVVVAHWIYHEDDYGDYYECSNCHDEYVVYEGDMFWKFCPTCGANMREVDADG